MRSNPRAVVATGHPEVTRIGGAVLAAGGNAFDAAVACGVASSVAEPCLTSLGGGGFLLARPAAGPPVLFEVAWTLRAAYGQDARDVLDVLEAILALPGLSLTDAPVCAEALRLARRSGVEFPDAYIAALAGACGAGAVATFNLSDFQKLGVRCHAL